jgi:hypothetical protein
MCDYSLQGLTNRLAKDGDELVVHRFDTGTLGMIAVDSVPRPANKPEHVTWWQSVKAWFTEASQSEPCVICVPPGARLVLHEIPTRLQQQYHVSATEEVMFTQTTPDAYRYRDAVRFNNGGVLSLQNMDPGQRVDVLTVTMIEEPVVKTNQRVHSPATR